MNISTKPIIDTATTCPVCCNQRAKYLSTLGSTKVLELRVGPSLRELEKAYAKVGIKVIGNDIEAKYQKYYPKGNWIIKDCLEFTEKELKLLNIDTLVFAPPLSKGCSGTREDSLSIDTVFPKYLDMLKSFSTLNINTLVLVLPGRTWSTRLDKNQYHKLLSNIYTILPNTNVTPYPLVHKVRKYLDLVIQKK